MSNRSSRDLTQGSIYAHIGKMALPMFLGMLAHMLLNIVDAIYVSRLGTAQSLAILNYSFPLFYIPFALYNGLSTGVAAILAQLIGSKNFGLAQKTLSQTVLCSLLMYFVLTGCYFIFIPLYQTAFKIPQDIFHYTYSYVSIVLVGMFFSSISLVLGGALRAEGNMRTGMNAMILGTLLNLILDPLFIFSELPGSIPGLGWGVAGAAWATNIASLAMFLYILQFYLRKKSLIPWPQKLEFHKTEFSGLKKVFQVAWPSMLSQSLMGFNTLAITYLASPFGLTAVGALGIGLRLDIIAIFPALSIMTAVTALVGQNYGAKNFDRLNESIRKGLMISFLFVGSIGMLTFFIRGSLIGLFKPNEQVYFSAYEYMGFNSLSYAFIGLAMVSAGAFQGLGKGMPNLFITGSRVLVLNFFLGYILSKYTSLGEKGLHLAPPLTNLVVGTIAALSIYKLTQKLILKNSNL